MSDGPRPTEAVEALNLVLHGQRVGVLTHYAGGKNILVFDPDYRNRETADRITLTLAQTLNPGFLSGPHIHAQRLSPTLSNLLPEGALRHWMASALKVHPDHEFPLLAWAGADLPGALLALPLEPGTVPNWALSPRDRVKAVQIQVKHGPQKFSLAGVQMKFSSARHDSRFTIGSGPGGDDWIVKTPSTLHKAVPENEYTSMRLAEAIGIDIPEIDLIPLERLDNLPPINLPDETSAYVIRRFDRAAAGRIHAEDFAQILERYPHDKYGSANYEQIAAALYHYSPDGLADVQRLAKRLLANILLANGDAHLKNWSVVYPDQKRPRLSPAYDIVSTLPYVPGETQVALNMAREKNWYALDLASFEHWAKRIGIPWPAIRTPLMDSLDAARTLWPALLPELPMLDAHKAILRRHWSQLTADFRLPPG